MIAGLDVGGTNARAILLEPGNGSIVDGERRSSYGDGETIVGTIVELARLLEARNEVEIEAVGLGVAGLAHRSGTVRYSPNLPSLVEFPLGQRVESDLGVRVVLANDANAGAFAEGRLGAGRGADDFLFVALGTGIGMGFVANGEIVLGSGGFAGEAGHMVVDVDGPAHRTGQRGPWEYFASGTALGRMGSEAAREGRFDAGAMAAGGPDEITGHHLVSALRAGDLDAEDIFDMFCKNVAVGVANLVLILDPERVVVGGGLVEIGERLREGVDRWLHRLLLGAEHRPAVQVVLGELGSDAGALGAGLLATT